MPRPRLALVPGEPAGIGPELCLRALARQWPADFVVLADRATLQQAADALALTLQFPAPDRMVVDGGPSCALLQVSNPRPVAFGHPQPDNAAAVVEALHAGGRGCIDGRYDGLVTGPVHKATVNQAGIAYSGTTELLARQAGRDVVMMLANDTLRVALATTHLPLRQVADAITPDALERVLRTVHAALRRDFGISEPRVVVLGLNPHAGEDGHLGREEIEVITPVLERLRGEGLCLEGPLPADTAFLPAVLARADAVLAMYHDQGLPVLKFSGFDEAVNLTLGLPYPRVAVDHGTALALAGRGVASPSSLFAAIATCTRLAGHAMARRGSAPA